MYSYDDIESLCSILNDLSYDPYMFVKTMFSWDSGSLSGQNIESWQKDILLYIKDWLINPKQPLRVAVTSGHGVGKSALVSWIILWALTTLTDTRGVVTANTETQLRTKTWAELQKWHNLFLLKDFFEWNATSISTKEKDKIKTWRIDAVTWNISSPESFAGLHNHGKRILVIFDEASGIPRKIWETTEGVMTDDNTQILWLVFGNPTRTDGVFYECFNKDRSRWHTLRIDSRTVERTNKYELDDMISRYGIESDVVKVRILGEFPAKTDNTLISAFDVDNAVKRELPASSYINAPKIFGVDIARYGTDNTVIAFRQGLKLHKLHKYHGLNTQGIVTAIINCINNYSPDVVFLDMGYIGSAVYDLLKDYGYDVKGVDFGSKSSEPDKYFNKRAEMWCNMGEWLIHADLIDDIDLKTDLISPNFYYKGDNGQLILEKKEEMRKRGLSSPDSADALALTFAEKINIQKKVVKLPSKKLGY